VLIPLAVYMYRTAGSRRARLCAFVAGVLILAGVALTQSRGAFLNLVLLTMAMIAVKWARPSRVALAGALLFVTASAVVPSFLTRVESIRNAASLLSDDPMDQGKADPAIRGRTTVMLAALAVFRDHPLLGVGPGQYKYYALEYSNNNPDIQFRQLETTRRAHSLYLETAAELGALGLTAFLAIVLHLMYRLWRARRLWLQRDARYAELATAFMLTLGAYLGTAVFEHLSFQRYYWFLLGLAGAALYLLYADLRATQPPATIAGRPGLADVSLRTSTCPS
jgi:putative inorganic carbon (hco3(-)) transporter